MMIITMTPQEAVQHILVLVLLILALAMAPLVPLIH